MKPIIFEGKNFAEAYHKALIGLNLEGILLKGCDYGVDTKEIHAILHTETPLAEPAISRLYIGGAKDLQQYEMEIMFGILDFVIGKGGTYWEYTYHDRFAHQIEFIIDELKRNPQSRRAIMNIRDFDIDTSNEHPACLQSIQYFIRNSRLDCKVMMRSNDAYRACFINGWGFIQLQQMLANRLNVALGSYTHDSHSFHIYQENFEGLETMVEKRLVNANKDNYYEYKNLYKGIMRESIPEIKQMMTSQADTIFKNDIQSKIYWIDMLFDEINTFYK